MVSVAVLGERVIDLLPGADGRYQAVPGGSPANVALGLARLGLTPLLLARGGDDGFSALLDNALTEADLDRSGVIDAPGLAMLAVCTSTMDGAVAYTFYHRDSPDLCWTTADLEQAEGLMNRSQVRAWHTGSLVSWLGSGVPALLSSWEKAAAHGRVTLSYDPNARPGAQARDAMVTSAEQFIKSAHMVKASDEDADFMYPGQSLEEVGNSWLALGAQIVVLTRGSAGACAWRSRHDVIEVPGFNVPVVDTVGAGDTVSAALIAGLQHYLGADSDSRMRELDDGQMATILTRACAAAAITCSRAGAQPPTLAELDQFLVAHPREIQP